MTVSVSRWRRPTLGWVVFAASCLWIAVGVLTGLGVGDFTGTGDYLVGDAIFVLGFTGLGAVVLSRQPRNRAGLLCLTPAFIAIEYVAGNYGLLAAERGLPGAVWVSWVAGWIWPLGVLPVGTLLLMLLPDGHLPHPRWRPVTWLIAGFIAAFAVAEALVPARPGFPPNPVGVPALEVLNGEDTQVFLVSMWAICSVAALLCMAHRVVRSRGQQRAQIGWIALGGLVFGLGKLLENVLPDPLASAVGFASMLALPVAWGVAILRYELMELNGLLRRLLLLVVFGTVLTGASLGLQALLGNDPLPATAATVGLALLAPVLHRWLGGRVNRLLYGSRGGPRDVLAGLGRRLATAAGPDDVMAALADEVIGAFPVDGAYVVLASSGRELRRVTRGATGQEISETVPLRFQGVELGRVEIAASRDRLDSSDRALLADLAISAAAAVAAAHRAVELQLAREQLVAAREQERRRIARDLHDGVGPVLSGLGFTLDALRATVRGSDEAEAVTAQARGQVREAVQLVRRVSRRLRPTVVDQLGLIGALRELAARHDGPTLDVQFDVTDGPGEMTARSRSPPTRSSPRR